MCRANKIGPDFQFHQQADGRVNIIEGTAHYPREIKGKIEDLMILAEKARRTGKTGVGGRANNSLEIADRNLRDATIRAPRSGTVISPKPNDLIDKQVVMGESLADIAIDNMKMGSILISEKDILLVKKGDNTSIVLQSMPGSVFKGTLSEISHAKIEDEEGNKSYIGYFTSDRLNAAESIRLGMSGSAKIHTGLKTLYLSSLKDALTGILTKIKLLFIL